MKNLKNNLKNSFLLPKSKNGKEFLLNFNYPYSTYFQFLGYQIKFIKKTTWVLSIITFLFYLITIINKSSIYIIFCIPIFIILLMYELYRSNIFKTYELEMTCKYSIVNILISKLFIISTFNSILIFILSIVFYLKLDINFITTIFYFFTPYFLSLSFSIFLLNKFQFKNILYFNVCILIILNYLYFNFTLYIFKENYISSLYLLFTISIIFTIVQIKKIKTLEVLNA